MIYVEGIGTQVDTFLQVHNISIYVALQVPINLCPYSSPSYCCYQQYSIMVYGAPGPITSITSMKGISYIGYINPYPLSGRTTWGMQQHMDNGSCNCAPTIAGVSNGMWVSTFWSNWLNSWQLTEKTHQRNGTFNMVLSQERDCQYSYVPMMVHFSDLCSWVSQGPATLGLEAQATPQCFFWGYKSFTSNSNTGVVGVYSMYMCV